jgi:hypothetical protein
VSSLDYAKKVFSSFMILLTCSNQEYKEGPLINYTKFLLMSLQKKNKELYLMINEEYSEIVEVDSAFLKYLGNIGKNYFGINNSNGGDMLSNLLGSFLQ